MEYPTWVTTDMEKRAFNAGVVRGRTVARQEAPATDAQACGHRKTALPLLLRGVPDPVEWCAACGSLRLRHYGRYQFSTPKWVRPGSAAYGKAMRYMLEIYQREAEAPAIAEASADTQEAPDA